MFQKAKGKDQEDSWFIRVTSCNVIYFVLLFCIAVTHTTVSPYHTVLHKLSISTLYFIQTYLFVLQTVLILFL